MMGTKVSKQLEIIDGAIRYAAEHGVLQTNANQVAKALKIRPSLVYYYFETEAGLLENMVQRIAQINNEQVNQQLLRVKNAKLIDQLRVYIEQNLVWGMEYPAHVAVLNHAFTTAMHVPGLAKLTLSALQVGEEKIFRMLAEGVAKNQFRIRCEIDLASRLIHQSLMGALVHSLGATAVIPSSRRKNLNYYFAPLCELLNALISKPSKSSGR